MTPAEYAGYTPPQGVTLPRPGDWFVVDPTGEPVFKRIEWAEKLATNLEHRHDLAWQDWLAKRKDPGWYRWGHAGVATRWARIDAGRSPANWETVPTGTWPGAALLIAEAEPHGAGERPWHWGAEPHMWSTGTALCKLEMGAAARRYTQPGPWGQHGVPYAFPDYGAIGAKALGLPIPGLDGYLAATWHMICSQLVDQAAQDRGLHLFNDGRAPGYVMPLDLAVLLLRLGRQVRSKPTGEEHTPWQARG